MERQARNTISDMEVGSGRTGSVDDWKHPLQSVTAYAEAIGRWLRQEPVNYDEIESALQGIEGAVLQSREILSDRAKLHPSRLSD